MKFDINTIEKEGKVLFTRIAAQYDNRAIIMTVILLAVLFIGLTRFIVPGFTGVTQNIQIVMEKKKTVDGLQKSIKDEEAKIRAGISKRKRLPVLIYETPYKNFELEIASSEMVSQIIGIINSYGNNKITALDFDKKELKDNIGVVSKQHSILVLKIEMESSYENLQKILNDLYGMDYLVMINTVTLISLEDGSHKRVKVYMELDLPVKTS
jgi:hypothetical protein